MTSITDRRGESEEGEIDDVFSTLFLCSHMNVFEASQANLLDCIIGRRAAETAET